MKIMIKIKIILVNLNNDNIINNVYSNNNLVI